MIMIKIKIRIMIRIRIRIRIRTAIRITIKIRISVGFMITVPEIRFDYFYINCFYNEVSSTEAATCLKQRIIVWIV